ncbi:MAG: helicase associated domain-containing protein [Paraprevotella sp.]|nr:helicase associated domain-containing protein [Paraprevotella sp.]
MITGKRSQNWFRNYELLKAYVKENKHLPGKRRVENRGLLNWWKYNRKLILQGKLDKERVQMLDELGQMRDMPRSIQLYADMFPED